MFNRSNLVCFLGKRDGDPIENAFPRAFVFYRVFAVAKAPPSLS